MVHSNNSLHISHPSKRSNLLAPQYAKYANVSNSRSNCINSCVLLCTRKWQIMKGKEMSNFLPIILPHDLNSTVKCSQSKKESSISSKMLFLHEDMLLIFLGVIAGNFLFNNFWPHHPSLQIYPKLHLAIYSTENGPKLLIEVRPIHACIHMHAWTCVHAHAHVFMHHNVLLYALYFGARKPVESESI